MLKLSGMGDLEGIGVTGILDSLPDGVYITNTDRRILYWNAAAERITGWRVDDVVGKSCRDNILVHVDKDGHELCGQDYCPLHRSIVTGHPSDTSLLVFARHKRGQRIPVEVSVAPLRGADGRIVGGIEIFRDQAQLTGDLWRAKAIQDHAMENGFPCDPRVVTEIRYLPQEVVGGDFYHAGRLADGRLAVMVADIMGHGVASALYGVQLRLLWEELADVLAQPAVFMSHMNRRLMSLVCKDGYFATAALVLLDPETGRLECTRAGHPSPLIVSPAGVVTGLEGQHPAFGLLADVDYAPAHATMGPADSLLLYTDGAVEIVNRSGVELGEAGLGDLVARLVKEQGRLSLEALEKELLSFGDGLRFADDLTMVRLTRCGTES